MNVMMRYMKWVSNRTMALVGYGFLVFAGVGALVEWLFPGFGIACGLIAACLYLVLIGRFLMVEED